MKNKEILVSCGLLLALSCATERTTVQAIPAMPTPATALAPTVVHQSQAPAARPKVGSPVEIRHLARGQNAYLGHLVLGPDMKVPVHRDGTEEYLYILSGAGTLYIDGTSYDLRAGHAVLMPANAEVHFENGPEELRAIQVFAGPAPAKKYDTWVTEAQ